jgi:phosphate transport system substrate-binding protein
MFIAAFSGVGDFYFYVIMISGILLLVFTFLHLFRFVKPKKMKTLWLVFVMLTAVSCAIREGWMAYDRSIVRIRERNVDLDLYAPFAENTLVAVLDTPSTLKLETDLPLLDGATALYPVYSAFAQAVYPKKNYDIYDSEVVCNKTHQAYVSLIDKVADIIFAAAPSQQQIDDAKEAGVSFRYTPIGKEAFVFFVNAQNPVDGLTVEQLQGIYSGEITNWNELGGNNERIHAFQRNENSGSQTAFINFMQGKTVMQPPEENVVGEMGGMVSQTADYANYGNAIGFSFRFYVNEMTGNSEVKILRVNGVYPDAETIANGMYPLASSFFAVTLADNNKPNVLKFLEWMVSEQGQYLVRETGYCTVKN